MAWKKRAWSSREKSAQILQAQAQMRDISAFSMKVLVTSRTAEAAASWAATFATRVLRCNFLREVEDGKDDGNRADELRDRVDGIQVHVERSWLVKTRGDKMVRSGRDAMALLPPRAGG